MAINRKQEEIIEVLTNIHDRRIMKVFLFDLLTPKEITEIANRWQLIQLLHRKVGHRDIQRKLNVGIATVSRGARQLKNGFGGFAKVLKRYE